MIDLASLLRFPCDHQSARSLARGNAMLRATTTPTGHSLACPLARQTGSMSSTSTSTGLLGGTHIAQSYRRRKSTRRAVVERICSSNMRRACAALWGGLRLAWMSAQTEGSSCGGHAKGYE